MALTKDERQKLDETHDVVIELRTVLLGKNSDRGIVGQVVDNTRRINRNTIILAAILGSGVLGGGVVGVIKLLT